MSSGPKLVFFGNERIATGVETTAPTLQALIAAGYQIMAVVVAQEAGGKSRKARPLEVAAIAEAHAIPLLAPGKLSEIEDQLKSYGAEAGVLVAFGKLVPESTINIFPRGIINIHPSLLPSHRGSIPIEAVILAGAKETGVSLMRLVKAMDAGPVYAAETVLLKGNETKQLLAEQLLGLGRDMLLTYLPTILDGSLEPIPQDEHNVSYDERLHKDSGVLTESDWDKPAEEIERMVRAYAGWPRVKTRLAAIDIIITSAHVGEGDALPGTLYADGKQFGVHAKDGVVLIDSLIPAGKKEMPAAAFLAGYKVV